MIDEIIPDGCWAFDSSVTRVFDDMLRRSIPQLDVMRSAVFGIGAQFTQPDTWVIDLGCSRGETLAPFVARFGEDNRYLGVEVSEPMALAARARFAGNERVVIRQEDLRIRRPVERASVCLSVLTLQFTPIEYRHRIVRDVFKSLLPGGAFILVEKVLGATAELDALLVKEYYDLKRANGYTDEQIDRKRLSLEGVLVPVTARWNEELLVSAGFRHIDAFWRYMNFVGWVAIKE